MGSITSSHILSPHKKSIDWADGVEITSRRYYVRRKPNLGGRMAEWLRPADCEVLMIKLRGINYQAAHLVSEKKTIWHVALVSITSAILYGAGICRYLIRGQDGRVVKTPNFHCRERTKYTPDKRGFDVLSLKKVHRLGGWC